MNLPRVTFQLCAELEPGLGAASAVAPVAPAMLGEVVDRAVEWVGEEFGAGLPPEAYAGQSFRIERPGHNVRAVAVPEHGLWTARSILVETEEAAAEAAARGAVPGTVTRRRTCDLALVAEDPGRVRVGMRVTVASPAGTPEDSSVAATAPPGLVLDLARLFTMHEAGLAVRNFAPEPWAVARESDLDALHALLVDPRRRLPVYVLTKPAPGSLGVETDEYLLDARTLAEQVLARAYVVLMPPAASFAWSERLGKRWSAYLGAVRTYRPGLDFEADDPTHHPLAMAERVMLTQYRGLQAEAAYARMLADQAAHHAATLRPDWGSLRFLEDAMILEAQRARAAATTPMSQVERITDEAAALHAKIDRLEEEREVALSLAAEAEQARDRAQAETARVREQLDALRAEFVARTGTSPDAGLELPTSYDDLPDWVATHLSGRLTLHPRALRGLRDAAYRDVGLVARALVLLADAYRNQKLGTPGANRVFEAGTRDLGLRIGRSIARQRAGEQGSTYFVRWPAGGEDEEFLEWHLRKGSGMDPRHCLAIYFFWDEPGQQVVVGWLPGHLENRMT